MTKLVERHDHITPAEPRAVKRLMQVYSDEDILRLLEVQRCDRLAHAPEHAEPPASLAELPQILREIRAEGACLSLRTLAVKGQDLLDLGIPAGRALGAILSDLLELVIDGELPNERERLLAHVREMCTR